MQFFSPHNFIYFWCLFLLCIIYLFSRKVWQSRIKLLGEDITIKKKLMPTYRYGEAFLRFMLLVLVFLFSIIALARPQWGEEARKIERKGIDVVFLLDTSLSMLAEDIKPNRFRKAKMEIKSIVRQMTGNRVGLVAFSGNGFLQTPLTLDYGAFFLFLDSSEVGDVPYPGTSLVEALKLAVKAFPEADVKHKALILLTDGEDNQGGLEDALKALKNANIRVYTIGVGGAEGAPIPLSDGQGQRTGFKKDRAGEIVMTRMNGELLNRIASETNGIYLPATPSEEEIPVLLTHMKTLGERTYQERTITEREDHYAIFLLFALICLIAELFIKRKIRLPKQVVSVVIFLALANLAFLKSAEKITTDGNQLYEEKKYQSAIDNYRKAQIKKPDDPVVRYNLATALYQVDEYREAAQELEKSIDAAKDDAMKANAYYNYGNTQYRLGLFEEAIESYQKALELNPDDEDAKYNLEFLEKLKNRFSSPNQKQQQQKQNQQQKDQQNQEQNQEQNQQQQQNQQNQNQGQSEQDPQQQDQQKPQDQQGQNQDQKQEQEQEPQDQEQPQDSSDQTQEDQKDKQGQQDQEKDSSDQQDQEQQEQEQEQEKEGDKPKDPQKDNSGQQDQQDQGDEEEKQDQKPQGEGKDQEQQQEPQPQDQSPQSPASQSPELGDKQPLPTAPREYQEMQGKPLQGQMPIENALRILDALQESEKDLSNLRKPPPGTEIPYVEKDW